MWWKTFLSETFRARPITTSFAKRNTFIIQQLRLPWVNVEAATRVSRGSPFQRPTRLADGLGPESGLETGCPASFAPSQSLGSLVPPHPASEWKPDLGCNELSKPNPRRFVNLGAIIPPRPVLVLVIEKSRTRTGRGRYLLKKTLPNPLVAR